MKFLIVVLLIFSVSCALIQPHSQFDFSSRVKKGDDISNVFTAAGKPLFTLDFQEETIHLFKSGLVVTQKGKVTIHSNYQYNYNPNLNFSQNVPAGAHAKEVLENLGAPTSVVTVPGGWYVGHTRGAYVIRDSHVAVSGDYLYGKDDVFNVSINAYSDQTASNSKKYFIMPGSKNVNDSDLQFKEVKSYLEWSLQENNFSIAENIEAADYVIFLNYGISDPKEDVRIVSTPVYNFNYVPGSNVGVFNNLGSQVGSLQTSGSFQTSYAGQNIKTIKTTNFTRWLNVEAVDYSQYKKTKSIQQIWKTMVHSTGPSGDLRFVLPVLSYALGTQLNTDSQKEQHFTVLTNPVNHYLVMSKYFSNRNSGKERGIAGGKK